jgi:succinate dehydrogenase / fumarate reductase cytochrome b subunit
MKGGFGMSTVAAARSVDKAARFYESTLGKKAVMAVTGIILFGYVIAHVLGNLQFFLGMEVMNNYAEVLHANPGLLWGVRIVLLLSVILHIWASIQLTRIKRDARPVRYVKTGNVQSSYASRTMMWSGTVIAVFVVYHLLHLTTGTVHPAFLELHPYENLVNGFKVVPVAIAYIVAMVLLGLHLSHGVWSAFQTLGFSHPRYTPMIRKFAVLIAWVIVAGFISIPLAVVAGVVR